MIRKLTLRQIFAKPEEESMSHRRSKRSPVLRHLFISLFVAAQVLLIAGHDAFAADLVTCRYLSSQGETISLELSIGSPPPASIIVVQSLPAGTEILSSSPSPQKFGNGEAKWLLKDTNPGRQVISIRVSPPISGGSLRGEIRYKDPATGSLQSMPIRP